MKKKIRIFIAVVLLVPSYPIFFMTGTVFGLTTVVGIVSLIHSLSAWLTDNKEEANRCLEAGLIMLFLPITLGPAFWWSWAIKGESII